MNDYSMRVFLDVLDTGSFAAAAKKSYISQPAVSSIINSLESEFGTTLLIRSRGQRTSFQLTEAGNLFAKFCRNAVNEYDTLKLQISSVGQTMSPFVLYASPSAHFSLVPSLLTIFRSISPDVECRYYASSSEKSINSLLVQKADLAIISTPSNNDLIQCESFLYDPMVLIGPPNTELGSHISIKKMKTLRFVMRNNTYNSMKILNDNFRKHGFSFDDLSIQAEVPSALDVLHIVESDSVYGFIPYSLYAATSLNSSKVTLIEVDKLRLDRYEKIARLKNQPLSNGAQSFWDFIFSSIWQSKIFPYQNMPKPK